MFYISFRLERSLIFLIILEKLSDATQIGGATRWRQGQDDLFAVVFGIEARIENSHHTTVIVRAQQASQALLQAQHCLGQNIDAKPVFASGLHLGHARLVDGVVRRIKGEFVYDDQRERLTSDVHAFPEALEAKEYGPFAFAETAHQLHARHVSLTQQREGEMGGQLALKGLVDLIKHAFSGEEQEGAPTRGLDQAHHLLSDSLGVSLRVWPVPIGRLWEMARQVEPGAAPVVEGQPQEAFLH